MIIHTLIVLALKFVPALSLILAYKLCTAAYLFLCSSLNQSSLDKLLLQVKAFKLNHSLDVAVFEILRNPRNQQGFPGVS